MPLKRILRGIYGSSLSIVYYIGNFTFTFKPIKLTKCYPAFFRGHQRVGTPEYLSMMRLRKIWAEGSFSVLKREHCISKIRKRGILAATEECLLAAMALNLKRMAKCHLSLSPNLLFCWNHCGFQQFFCFCQQVQLVALSLIIRSLKQDLSISLCQYDVSI